MWVNRDFQSFEWFVELLGQIELQQLNLMLQNMERFIGIHLYMTSSKNEREIRPMDNPEFDMMGQIDDSEIEDFSLKLQPGRPDIEKLFTEISSNRTHDRSVDVFFCGNREFGKIVEKESLKFGFNFSKEHF